MLTVRAVRSGEASRLRDLRLRALADSPDAFASTHQQESGHPDGFWAELASSSEAAEVAIVCVAIDGERWVGMAAGRWFDRERGIAALWGMWVDPDVRRDGVGARLVTAVRGWASGHDAHFLRLGILEGPDDATGFYERLGFVQTGERRPLVRDPSRQALFLVRPV